MLVSIIVPVYNVEKYLCKCLDSIKRQTYKNIEVIMIDDGSEDSSGRICDKYANRYDNFRVIHKENEGLGMARNTGLKYICGDYVTFIDSDDYIDDFFIETLLEAIQKNKVDVCKSGFKRVTDESILDAVQYKNELFEKDKASTEFLPRLIGSKPDKKDSIGMSVWATLYSAKPIKDHRLLFPSERELISEDLVFNIDYMQYANGACTLSYVGYNYRFNPESLSAKYRKDRFEASRYFYLEIKNKLKNMGYGKDSFLRLQRLFFIYVRMSIEQETSTVSGHSPKESIRQIKKICNDKTVQTCIQEYPSRKLGIAQILFLYLVKLKQVRLLYLYFELKVRSRE